MGGVKGRHAVVTGGSRGIGSAIASALIEAGASVTVVDVEEPGGDRPFTFHRFDLAQTDQLPQLVERIEHAGGDIDILVNNAAIAPRAPAVETSYELYRSVLRVNLDAPVILSTIVGRGMIDRGRGRIVNISSVHGRHGESGALAYDVAKGGLDQATRTLAVEWASAGVLVNAVAPGFVATEMSSATGENELESDWFRQIYVEHGHIPLQRPATPAEIAVHVTWLASDQNTYLTGQVVTVDGGMTVRF